MVLRQSSWVQLWLRRSWGLTREFGSTTTRLCHEEDVTQSLRACAACLAFLCKPAIQVSIQSIAPASTAQGKGTNKIHGISNLK